jgi:RNA polymerase sigma-70 factor, ECF subfamily
MLGLKKKKQEYLSAYDAYADALFRHCYFRLYDREAAKDAVQDTFVHTWEYISTGHTVDNMRAFLYRVANNIVIDRTRKPISVSLDNLHEKGFDLQDEGIGARVEDIISGREVIKILDKLEDPHKTVVIMRYIDNLMPREIALILGETENIISVRIHRAVRKARELWEQGVIHNV